MYELPNMKKYYVGKMIFTREAVALYKAVSPDYIEGYWDDICLPWFSYATEMWEADNKKIVNNSSIDNS